MSPVSTSLIWVHEEALRDDHPAYTAAPDGTRRVFVWDAMDFETRAYALKRLVFIHECLQDMSVDVIEGDVETVLDALAPDTLYTAKTPDPSRRAILARLSKDMNIHEIADQPLASVPANTDMGRFFRFWNRARRSVMSFSSEMSDPATKTNP